MDEALAHFLLSDKVREAPPENLAVYLLLRADFSTTDSEITKSLKRDGKAATTISVIRLAELTKFNIGKIHRILDELVKTRWIKKIALENTVVELGEIKDFEIKWHITVPIPEVKKESPIYKLIKEKLRLEKERELARVPKKGLARETRKIIASKIVEKDISFARREKRGCKEILEHFQKLYVEKYSAKCPLIEVSGANPYPATYAYIKRAIEWLGDDWREVIRLVEFIFKNWDDLRIVLKIDGRPNFHILGSSKLCLRVYNFMIEGIPRKTKVLDRFDEKKERPPVGW